MGDGEAAGDVILGLDGETAKEACWPALGELLAIAGDALAFMDPN